MLRIVLPLPLASLTSVNVSVGVAVNVSVELVFVVDVDIAVVPIAIAPIAANPRTQGKSRRPPGESHARIRTRDRYKDNKDTQEEVAHK